jgi:ketosteroid isomerase-like protein
MYNQTPAEIEAEVRARSKALVEAEETGDYRKAISFFTSDTVIQPANAPQIQGWDPLLQLYETVLAETAEFEGTTTAIIPASSGDMAYEYGVNRFVFETPEGPMEAFGKYFSAWRKINGEWLVAALAFSDDSPPPA